MFNQYPYLNLNDLNLDYLLNEIKSMYNDVTNFVSINAIKYADPIQWNITSQYEKNTVVIDPLTGTAYISVAPVPSGVALTRTEYWTVVFDLGSFVTRAAQNFTSHWEEATTLTATFPTSMGGWLVWGDVLYKALTNITAGDSYVVGGNIEHFTIEDLYNAYLNTIAQILAKVGDLTDLTTSDTSDIVHAINSVLSDLNGTIGDLDDLATSDKTSVVNAINSEVTDRTNADNAIMARIDDFKIVNARDYGVVGDGVTDDTTALRNWLVAVRAACTAHGARLGYVHALLPSGVYKLTGKLNFSLYFESGHSFEYIYFDMLDAQFQIDSSYTDTQLLNIAPAGTSQFVHCQFDIGNVVGNVNVTDLSNIRMYNVNDCIINLGCSINAKMAALYLDQSSAQTSKRGIFNNIFNITSLGYGEYGLLAITDPNDSIYAIQGNTFNITHIFNNTNGINLDFSLAYSNLNTFNLGAVEFNTGVGIVDNSGNNQFYISSCNGQTNDFFLQTGARPDYVVGTFAGYVNLHNIPSRFLNLALPTGKLATQPALAGVGIDYYNPNAQSVQVHCKGDTLSSVYINSQVFANNSSGHLDITVILRPSDRISMIYDPADTTVQWLWFGI